MFGGGSVRRSMGKALRKEEKRREVLLGVFVSRERARRETREGWDTRETRGRSAGTRGNTET